MKRFVLVLVSAVMATTAAADPAVDDATPAWLQRSEALIEQALEHGTPEWATPEISEEYLQYAEEIRANAPMPQEKTREERKEAVYGGAPDDRYFIFVSFSLGDAALRSIFEMAAGKPNVFIAFRGFLPGDDLKAHFTKVHTLLKGIEPVPNVTLDPELFAEFAVDVAPEMVMVRNGKEIARVQGTATPEWIREQVRMGRDGDLGVFGSLREIIEPDLIEVMKQKAAGIDWEEKARAAKARFWNNRPFIDLPQAEEDRSYTVDPTIEVTDDFRTPDGALIAAKGTRINPLSLLPFTKRVIVFDGTNAKQIEKAAELVAAARAEDKGVTVIATRIPVENGWDELDRLERSIGGSITLLTKEVAERFRLRAVPASIESTGTVFLINEYRP